MGSPIGLASAYGSSELFSCICTELPDARVCYNKQVMSVGIPYAGIIVGVFDESGKELTYNQRGELWIKSHSAMKGYYKKTELTAQIKIDGWIHTGDLAEIDENGFVYIWGRMKDTVSLSKGNEIYLFDIANKIKEKEYIDDAVVLPIIGEKNGKRLVAHIVFTNSFSEAEKVKYIEDLNKTFSHYLPRELSLYAYAVHDVMLPYSPTTLKKDKNRMSKQLTGYVQVRNGILNNIEFIPDGKGGCSICEY